MVRTFEQTLCCQDVFLQDELDVQKLAGYASIPGRKRVCNPVRLDRCCQLPLANRTLGQSSELEESAGLPKKSIMMALCPVKHSAPTLAAAACHEALSQGKAGAVPFIKVPSALRSKERNVRASAVHLHIPKTERLQTIIRGCHES